MPEIPKGYKQTEVGVIPEEWNVKRLRDVATIATGNTPPTSDISNYGDEFLFVSPVDMGDSKCITKTEKMLSHKGFAMSRRFPKDSILFVSIGSTIGKCGLAPVELTSNQQINAIFPSTSFASEYLYYAVSAAASRIKAQAGEQAVPIVNKTQFSHTGIAFPSFSEQRAIAAALSDADAWIESLEKLIEKQRAVKQGAMQALLTPPGQPGHQRLPGFKGAWEVKRLGEVVSPRTDRLDPTSVTDTTFCVELEHMISGTGMLTNDAGITGGSSLKSIFHPGDVLYGKLRAYLRKFWFADRPGVCSTEIWVLAADTLILRPEYLYQVVKSNFFLDATNTTYGTHMPRSDWNVVRELKLALPTLPEQSAIATVLSDLDAEVEALEAKLAKARQIKQGMMQELLTGRVRLV